MAGRSVFLRFAGSLTLLALGCGGADEDRDSMAATSITTLSTIGGTDGDTADGGDTDGDSDTDGNAVQFLEVLPVETLLELDLNTPSSLEFTVRANFTDGTTLDVTDEAEWTVTNESVGTMSGTTLEIPGFADPFFESTIITAVVGDEVGKAQVTVAAYDLLNDFFFILPFEDGDGPQEKPLTFSTDVKAMDVFINMDVTGSMADEINNLRAALSGEIIPAIQAQVPDTEFGAGSFADFPLAPYGDPLTDQPFRLLQPITANITDVQIEDDARVPRNIGIDAADHDELHQRQRSGAACHKSSGRIDCSGHRFIQNQSSLCPVHLDGHPRNGRREAHGLRLHRQALMVAVLEAL